MGCGASAAAPKYEVADGAPVKAPSNATGRIEAAALKAAYTSAVKTDKADRQWDTFLSYEETGEALAGKVRDYLQGDHYRVPIKRAELDAQLQGVLDSRKVVIFLTPAYFDSAECCAEFCEAVRKGVEVMPVCVEGSSWAGMPFPALTDVPEAVETANGTVWPRDAAGAVFGHTIAIDHKAAYVEAFLDKLRERLGPPAAATTPASGNAAGGAAAASGERAIRFDAFLSHKRSEAQDTVARVHDKLTDLGYRAFIDRNDLVELPSLGPPATSPTRPT
jgi:hypothetical protein